MKGSFLQKTLANIVYRSQAAGAFYGTLGPYQVSYGEWRDPNQRVRLAGGPGSQMWKANSILPISDVIQGPPMAWIKEQMNLKVK